MFDFLKAKQRKKKVIVFVDYESWFYSYRTIYNLYPDIREFRARLEKEYDIVDIMVFGDFSNDAIANELVKLRQITNTIIETSNIFNRRKKDMTDFIMLDYIYQFVDANKKIDNYVIFTGDGHFQSVTKYLVQKKKKHVVVYAVRDSISRQLREAASELIELPSDKEIKQRYYKLIVNNFEYVYNHPKIVPTFKNTAEAVALKYGVELDDIKSTLGEMIDKGYIKRITHCIEFHRPIKALSAQWDKLREAGLWELPKQEGGSSK